MLNVANSTVINALVTNMINIFIFKYILDANDDILKKCRKKTHITVNSSITVSMNHRLTEQ